MQKIKGNCFISLFLCLLLILNIFSSKEGNVVYAETNYISKVSNISIPNSTADPDLTNDSGDVNEDGVIDILDIAEIASHYNLKSGEMNWNINYDINKDGIINIYDLVSASKLINYILIQSISLNKTADILSIGDTDNLTAIILPDNSTNKNVEWTSSDASIATIDNTGKLTAIGAGTATITAVTEDGGLKANCIVTVNPADSDIESFIKNIINKNVKNRVQNFTMGLNTPSYISYENVETYVSDAVGELVHSDPYDYYNITSYGFGMNWLGMSSANLNFNFYYTLTKDQEDALNEYINSTLINLGVSHMSEIDKEKAIHDWIINNTSYDTSFTIHDAYNTYTQHKGICSGYALLTYKMLTMAGIQTNLIVGTAAGGVHMWNTVNIGGEWYHLDVTWDDPICSVPILRYDYFNITSAEMSKDHSWDPAEYPGIQ